jgi:hypothetical protein
MRTVLISTVAAFNAPPLVVYGGASPQQQYPVQYAPQTIVQMETPIETTQDGSLGWWGLGAGALVVGAVAALRPLRLSGPEPDLELGTPLAALAVAGSFTPAVRTRTSSPKMATIGSMLETIQGPDLYWEEKGPLQDPPKEESDFKEYDTFSIFLGACAKHGVDLNQPGITVLAPSNRACEQFSSIYGELTKDVCAYHLIKGEVKTDSLSSADLTTAQGSKITYRRMFRKDFLDDAFCAVTASPPRTSYEGNIQADNGYIHMINEVIYPGWSESAGGYGSEGDATRA